MFEIRRTPEGTLAFEGRFDAAQEEKARTALDGITESTALDFAKLQYIASAGLGILLHAQKRLLGQGKTLRIVNLSPHMREIFQMVGFDRIFKIE
jgi:anti-anti-sigma factor